MAKALTSKFATDPAAFRRGLQIDADGIVTPFRPDDWQERDFVAMDAAWMFAAGRSTKAPKVRRAWLERPRGHSKTSDIAIIAAWILAFANRPIRGVAGASDMVQARLLVNALETLCRCNPFLAESLEIQSWKVVNKRTGATLDILSSDESTSYGQLPDFVVCDEITHWKGDGLWHSLFSASAKKSGCVLSCIMNAGFEEHFAYKVREAVRIDPAWHFSHLDGAKASWISAARLAEQKRILPAAVYDRLWGNRWSSGSGDALTEADILAAVDMAGPIDPTRGDLTFVAGLDVGIRRDRTAFCILGIDPLGHAHLAALKIWIPGFVAGLLGRKTVDLTAVQSSVEQACREWALARVFGDPWQCEQIIQNLSRIGLPVEGIAPSVSVLSEMATVLLEKMGSDRSVHLYRHDQLLADLRKLRLIDKPGGYRLESPRGPDGHGDAASAFLLALLAGKRLYGEGGFLGSLDGAIGVGDRISKGLPSDIWNSAGVESAMRPGEEHFRVIGDSPPNVGGGFWN